MHGKLSFLQFSSSTSPSLLIYPPPIQNLHPQGLTSQMLVGQMPVGRATVSGPEHQRDTQGRASLNVWSAQCQGFRRRQHRSEHKGQKLKFLIPPGIEPGRPGWKAGILPTTATDFLQFSPETKRLIIISFTFHSPRIQIEISDPSGNRTRDAGLERHGDGFVVRF